jgi:hypothetical protein
VPEPHLPPPTSTTARGWRHLAAAPLCPRPAPAAPSRLP